MKKLSLFFLFLLIPILTYADDTAILKPNLDILIPQIMFEGEKHNLEVYLEFSENINAWVLKYVKESHHVDVKEWGTDQSVILSEINRYRLEGAPCSSGGKLPISWDSALEKAALYHSVDMAINNHFSHTGTDGSHFSTRIRDAGFLGFPRGENIAMGYTTPESVVNGWINSPGHCRNIMEPTITHIGYAWAKQTHSKYHTFVTGVKY